MCSMALRLEEIYFGDHSCGMHDHVTKGNGGCRLEEVTFDCLEDAFENVCFYSKYVL